MHGCYIRISSSRYSTEFRRLFSNVEVLIADLVKKLEEQKAEAERQLKATNRQMKVRKCQTFHI